MDLFNIRAKPYIQMEKTIPDTKYLLIQIGYHEDFIPVILKEFEDLLTELDFESMEQASAIALESKDNAAFVNILKNLMKLLENKGYYRPDYPTRLIKLLVNGLNLRKEDIFYILANSDIPQKEKLNEMEFLASCAAITQLGYILLSRLIDVKAASSGPHVFLVIDRESSLILADFSIDSIIEINTLNYEINKDHYLLKSDVSGLDEETMGLLKEYYSSFHVTTGIGLGHNIHNNLGIAYDKAGLYAEAIEELNSALRLDPEYVEAMNNLAVALDKMGSFDEALNYLSEAIRLKKDYPEAHCNLGTIYAKLGRFDDAIREINESIRLNPRFAVARNNLGNVYGLCERNDDAVKEFREAISIDPNYPAARSNLGNIYYEIGKHKEALIEFQEALKLDPEFAEAYHGIGKAYYDLGSLDRASQAFIRAVSLEPELMEGVPDKLVLKVRQGALRFTK